MRTWQPKIQFSVSLFLTKLWPWSLIKFINTLWKMFKKISLKLLSLSHYVKVWKISLKVFQNRSILMLLPSQKMRLLSPLIACHQLYNYKVWTWLDTHLNRRYVLQSYLSDNYSLQKYSWKCNAQCHNWIQIIALQPVELEVMKCQFSSVPCPIGSSGGHEG